MAALGVERSLHGNREISGLTSHDTVLVRIGKCPVTGILTANQGREQPIRRPAAVSGRVAMHREIYGQEPTLDSFY
jgi:hypothetical protein